VTENQGLISGRYELGRIVGVGGMATVYAARDTLLNRDVAIKLLHENLGDDPRFDALFKQEARAASSLDNPNIVKVLDAGEDSYTDALGDRHQRSFIVMEFVDGLELSRLTARGPLKVSEATRVAAELLSALDYAHAAGIVHRDIKPSNIMITRQGKVKILDFGIARAVSETFDDLSQTTEILGTAAYFSPEQARGEQIDARTDVYAAAVVIYEMLAGRPPFTGENAVAVAHQHIHAEPVAPSTFNRKVSPALDMVVLYALNKDRDARYQTAADFGRELGLAAAGHVPRSAEPATDVDIILAEVSEMAVEDDQQLPPEFAALFGSANQSQVRMSAPPPLPERRRLVMGGIVVALIFAVIAGIGIWVATLKPADIFPNSSRTIPAVENLTYNQAMEKLGGLGLTTEQMTENSTEIGVDKVIRTEPPAGTKVEAGSKVRAYVSLGKAKAQVPNVAGMTQADATAAIKASGFQVGTITPGNSATVKLDRVVSTNPTSGTELNADGTVNLIVSNGKFELPDLKGKTIKDAGAELSKLLVNPVIKADPDCPKAADPTVNSQSVKPGLITQGTPLTLTYCSG
jgi:serine/threonine protein kinase/beta-lactam-binding protein with PASTA domain